MHSITSSLWKLFFYITLTNITQNYINNKLRISSQMVVSMRRKQKEQSKKRGGKYMKLLLDPKPKFLECSPYLSKCAEHYSVSQLHWKTPEYLGIDLIVGSEQFTQKSWPTVPPQTQAHYVEMESWLNSVLFQMGSFICTQTVGFLRHLMHVLILLFYGWFHGLVIYLGLVITTAQAMNNMLNSALLICKKNF